LQSCANPDLLPWDMGLVALPMADGPRIFATPFVVGIALHREKALDFMGRKFRHCPPVCAGFLLGGTCDRVLTVFDSHRGT
jgi:hypothetical protein